MRSFELRTVYAEGRNITKDRQKRSLMLHCAGNAVQDIFFTLKIEDTYQAAVNTLTKHFLPVINLSYEGHLFRITSQKRDETVDQFVTPLRQKAETCFSDNLEERIVEQFIEQCVSERLRLKFLKASKTLTLRNAARNGQNRQCCSDARVCDIKSLRRPPDCE